MKHTATDDKIQKKLTKIFDKLFPEVIKSYEKRYQQYEMSEKILEVLCNNKKLVIEAPTGVGKSLSYLIAAVLFQKEVNPNVRVLVSTYTKTLQQQLLNKDIPIIEKIVKKFFNKELRYHYLYGSENYVCLHKYYEISSMKFLSNEERVKFDTIGDWIKTTITGCVEEIDIETDLWAEINREPDLCRGKSCNFYDLCFYFQNLRYAKDADIVVLNHHLFFANIIYSNKLVPKKNKDCEDIIIFDEAHNLEEVALQWLGAELSNTQLKFFCRQIYNSKKNRGLIKQLKSLPESWKENLIETIKNLSASNGQFFSELMVKLPFKKEVRIFEPNIVEDSLTPALRQLLGVLQSGQNLVNDDLELFKLKSFSNRVINFISILNFWLHCEDKNFIYWVETENFSRGIRVTLKTTPLDIANDMQEKVYSIYDKIIFTSATIAINKNVDFFKKSIGLIPKIVEYSDLEDKILSSPFDFESNVILFLPRDVPDPKNEENGYRNFVAKIIKDMIKYTCGNTFVLFTSYEMIRWVYDKLRDDNEIKNYKIFIQEGAKYKLLEKFNKTENSVLFGVDTFWQGVDIPGEKLISIIIPRLPFDVPQHPVVEAKLEKIRAEGRDPFREYSLPNAIIKLKQGFGRLIRRKNDWGIVTIIDPRITSRWYGKHFLSTLPKCNIVYDFYDVKNFYKKKKVWNNNN